MSLNLGVRSLAVKILTELSPNYSGYEKIIKKYKQRVDYSESDEQFLYKLVNGVIIYKKLLDFIINQTYHSSPNKLEEIALNLLRVGAYQKEILGTPSHAYVYETVECARELGREELTGLVNGVLRNLPDKEEVEEELHQLKENQELSIKYSHPEWMVKKWKREFGASDTKRLLQFNNDYTEIFFKHNPLKISWDGLKSKIQTQQNIEIIQKKPVVFFKVENPGKILKSSLLEKGYCSVQDFSQSLAVLLLEPKKGEKVIDCCAAPGGKSSYIAQLVDDEAELIQADNSQERLTVLEENMEQLGISNNRIIQSDANEDEFPAADRILLDVPCTGTGVTARKADLRWNRNRSDIENYAKIQFEMLKNMSKYVKKGGTLVYSTCSLEKEENWQIVEQFLSENDKFSIQDARDVVAEKYCDKNGAIFIKPYKNKLTGSFAVKLTRDN